MAYKNRITDQEYHKHENQLRPVLSEVLEWLEGRPNERMAVVYDFDSEEWVSGPLLGTGDRLDPNFMDGKFVYIINGWRFRETYGVNIRERWQMENDMEAMAKYPENTEQEMVYDLESNEWCEEEDVIQMGIDEMEHDLVPDILREFFEQVEE